MNPLSKRLKKGEASAFAELYEMLGEKLFRYAHSKMGSRADAADLVQETFVRLVKSHRSLGKAENLSGYVFATARTEIIRWHKNQQRRKPTPNCAAMPQSFEGDRSLEANDWVHSVLERLDPVDAEIVRLKAITQLTFKEVSAALNLKQANVTSRYRRALAKLGDHLTTDTNTIRQS